MARVHFADYTDADLAECLDIFDANCPEFFAPNEREDYLQFLSSYPAGYEVCRLGERLAGAYGLLRNGDERAALNWILISPDVQGEGIGTSIMERVLERSKAQGLAVVTIAASHKSAPFFARFGAVTIETTADGWGPGMHRVDMEVRL